MSEVNSSQEEKKAANDEPATETDVVGKTSVGVATELDSLRQQIEAKDLEAKNNYERFVRQVAETENIKKRLAREKDEAIRFAIETLVRDLLPVIDNLERAVQHSQNGGDGKPLIEGVEMVVKGLADVLNKHGIVQISALGQSFDPSKHEAMAQIECATQEANTVVEEFHKGYLFKDRLLRPALVSVAKAPISKEKKNDGREVENSPSDD
jgi:molecular chaperone GrpE